MLGYDPTNPPTTPEGLGTNPFSFLYLSLDGTMAVGVLQGVLEGTRQEPGGCGLLPSARMFLCCRGMRAHQLFLVLHKTSIKTSQLIPFSGVKTSFMIQRRLISYGISKCFVGGSTEVNPFHLHHPLQIFHKLFPTGKDSFFYTSHLTSGFQVLFFCWYQVLLCDILT